MQAQNEIQEAIFNKITAFDPMGGFLLTFLLFKTQGGFSLF